ncbi:MAG: ComF family protein [Desulfobacterales bacterium]|nr:ComF family protein [Desulfobacterales bacterium]
MGWNSYKDLIQITANQLSHLIFPDKCVKCGVYNTRDKDIPFSVCYCPTCMDKPLPFYTSPYCTVCGEVFESKTGEDHLCESCLKKTPDVERVRAAFEYQGLIREAVSLFKYQSRFSLISPLERYLFQAYNKHFADIPVDLIIPIPLHPSKARKRGFNQSYLLARRFPKLYQKEYGQLPSWKVDFACLARTKPTSSQTGLDIKQREKNLKQAFVCKDKSIIKHKHILLVDDVFTTGATCNAAARVLIKAGAASVSALVLARA